MLAKKNRGPGDLDGGGKRWATVPKFPPFRQKVVNSAKFLILKCEKIFFVRCGIFYKFFGEKFVHKNQLNFEGVLRIIGGLFES